jgi:PhoPQ-activated pathogenicity-related protein
MPTLSITDSAARLPGMRFRPVTRALTLAICLPLLPLTSGFAQSGAPAQEQTALDRYVAAPDPNYRFELATTLSGKGYTAFVLDMTSQKYLTEKEVDRPLWKHWVTIIRPDKLTTSRSLLFITGGSNRGSHPTEVDRQLAEIAVATQSVVTELRMVPNQPLVFAGDGKSRTEDSAIAFTWDKYLRTGDERWPMRLPMTKAAVRAMDTVTSFLGSAAGGQVKVNEFIVAGASKRGWTTWTAAVVDKRVIGIIPIVIDLLNVVPSFRHHYAAYGYWAPAVGDYEEQGIMEWESTSEYAALMKIVEPFEYRERLTLPKFIVNATGDQFFLPDSWKFYFQELKGPKYLRYVPNTDHSLRGSDAWFSVLAYYSALLSDAPIPQFDWNVDQDGTIRVRSTTKPTAVRLWQASNPGARDFRLTTIGPRWKSTPLEPDSNGEYAAKPAKPRRGWTAYMIEVTYPGSTSRAPFKFTSGVVVTPDTLPFADEPLPSRGKPQPGS